MLGEILTVEAWLRQFQRVAKIVSLIFVGYFQLGICENGAE